MIMFGRSPRADVATVNEIQKIVSEINALTAVPYRSRMGKDVPLTGNELCRSSGYIFRAALGIVGEQGLKGFYRCHLLAAESSWGCQRFGCLLNGSAISSSHA